MTTHSVLIDDVMARQGTFTVGPLSLKIDEGEVLTLIGPNGAGKTTLLRCIVGLQAPAAGDIHVRDEPVVRGRMPSGVGALIEEPKFHLALSGIDNLRLAAAGRSEWEHQIDSLLDVVGLHDKADTRVGAYSQGMRQRLGLARVLLGNPGLVILDEPTNGLDPQGIFWLRGFVRQLASEGRAVLLTSHLLHEVQAVADSVVLLYDGQILAQGPMASVAEGHESLEALYVSLVNP